MVERRGGLGASAVRVVRIDAPLGTKLPFLLIGASLAVSICRCREEINLRQA